MLRGKVILSNFHERLGLETGADARTPEVASSFSRLKIVTQCCPTTAPSSLCVRRTKLPSGRMRPTAGFPASSFPLCATGVNITRPPVKGWPSIFTTPRTGASTKGDSLQPKISGHQHAQSMTTVRFTPLGRVKDAMRSSEIEIESTQECSLIDARDDLSIRAIAKILKCTDVNVIRQELDAAVDETEKGSAGVPAVGTVVLVFSWG